MTRISASYLSDRQKETFLRMHGGRDANLSMPSNQRRKSLVSSSSVDMVESHQAKKAEEALIANDMPSDRSIDSGNRETALPRVITPDDVIVTRRDRLLRQAISGATLLASVAVMIVVMMNGSPATGAFSILIAVLSLTLLVLSSLDTTPLLVSAAFVQQERYLGAETPSVEGTGDTASAGDESLVAPEAGTDAPESVGGASEENGYRDRMSQRGQTLRHRLSHIAPRPDGTASALVTDEASWQTQRAERAYATAMSAIDGRFEANSLSWQRFSYGARTGYEKVLDNCEAVAMCLESLDISEYDGGFKYWDDSGERIEPPVPVPSSAYKPTHNALIRLVKANDGILDGLTRLSCDLTGMMADEATDGTAGVTEYIQNLVHDVPEYRTDA